MNANDHVFGEIAIALSLLSRADVERAMRMQKRRPNTTIGQLCKQLGLLTESQVEHVLGEQRRILERRRSARAKRRHARPVVAKRSFERDARELGRLDQPKPVVERPPAVERRREPRMLADELLGDLRVTESAPRHAGPAAGPAPAPTPSKAKTIPPIDSLVSRPSTPTNDRHGDLLGRLAVDSGMLTMDQLGVLTRQQGRMVGKLIGELLVEKGYATQEQIDELLDTQRQLRSRTEELRAIKVTEGRDPVDLDGLPLTTDASSMTAAIQAETNRRPAADLSATLPVLDQRVAEAEDSPKVATHRRTPTDLDGWLKSAIEGGASDVLLHAGAQPRLRRLGELANLANEPLPDDVCRPLLLAALDDAQRAQLGEAGELDLAYASDVGRFRANIYEDQRGLCGVFHYIPAEPPTLHDLDLPGDLAKVVNVHQGLVLITGPAGCGKTSTLAALINILNEERAEHILTAEDPVEYLHRSKSCLVNQRQVHRDTASFGQALRAALREDPDVICIGELRDLETIALALSAAETGHLVLATMHNASAIRAINSLVGAYPPEQQPQVRTMLSESLRAVIAQRLLPRRDGTGMALALELLLVNRAVSNLIRENRTFQLGSVLQMGKGEGMRMLDHSLAALVESDVISVEVARAAADNPERFAAQPGER
ncbi:MAG: hypothetical protein CSA65_00515 [Proteobacteria bacterium]|nr:MAG: hypothetical protein CSB49_00075 [Pseudomonadota bacterium]PIE19959.1 MAG: hypothetical protein CSA65_00515 [Pseudomonadota bacterium]